MESISPTPAAPAASASDASLPQPAGAAGSPSAGQPSAGKPAALTAEQAKAAVDAVNQALAQSNQGFAFVFDDTSGRMIVKIIDKQTNTVVRLVPSSQHLLESARAASAGSPGPGTLLNSEA